jgi:hypothetical protein
MRRTSRRRFGAVFVTMLAVVALAVLAAGCGGSSSSGSGVAVIEDSASPASDADSSGGTTQAGQEDFQQAALDYAECMRENGIDVPDPDFSGGGGGGLFGPNSDIDPDDPDFQAAQEECGDIIQGSAPQISEEQQQALEDTLLEFAQCMRENGVDVPDPDFSGGGGGIFVGPGGNGEIDPDDPDFQAAQEECGDILQDAGFGGPGGGPPGGDQGEGS